MSPYLALIERGGRKIGTKIRPKKVQNRKVQYFLVQNIRNIAFLWFYNSQAVESNLIFTHPVEVVCVCVGCVSSEDGFN